MALYASTFASGLQKPVGEIISRCIPGAQIIDLLDGIVTYRTAAGFEGIKRLNIFQNTFLVLRRFEGASGKTVEGLMRSALKDPHMGHAVGKAVGARKCRYRIVTSHQNKLVAVDRSLLGNVEKVIERSTSLRLDRSIPDIEFWFLCRRERLGFFMLRLTIHASAEKVLKRGELRPELCQILCSLSEPSECDVFLDPFCGSGSIPRARSLMPHRRIHASDIDPTKVDQLKRRVHKERKAIQVNRLDALGMAAFDDHCIDKIVTDPPWGIYSGLEVDIGAFYGKMLEEFARVLKVGGIAVILTARGELEAALEFQRSFKVGSKFDILVSGRKASVYKLVRILI